MDEAIRQYIRTSQALFVDMQQRISALSDRVKNLEDMIKRRELPDARRTRRNYETWARIQELKGTGTGARGIAAQTSLPVSTVYRYLQTSEADAANLPHIT